MNNFFEEAKSMMSIVLNNKGEYYTWEELMRIPGRYLPTSDDLVSLGFDSRDLEKMIQEDDSARKEWRMFCIENHNEKKINSFDEWLKWKSNENNKQFFSGEEDEGWDSDPMHSINGFIPGLSYFVVDGFFTIINSNSHVILNPRSKEDLFKILIVFNLSILLTREDEEPKTLDYVIKRLSDHSNYRYPLQ